MGKLLAVVEVVDDELLVAGDDDELPALLLVLPQAARASAPSKDNAQSSADRVRNIDLGSFRAETAT
jgi:hypothetical protein